MPIITGTTHPIVAIFCPVERAHRRDGFRFSESTSNRVMLHLNDQKNRHGQLRGEQLLVLYKEYLHV